MELPNILKQFRDEAYRMSDIGLISYRGRTVEISYWYGDYSGSGPFSGNLHCCSIGAACFFYCNLIRDIIFFCESSNKKTKWSVSNKIPVG